jgi:pimeloyl-ACP methyl ester carboxylesterase
MHFAHNVIQAGAGHVLVRDTGGPDGDGSLPLVCLHQTASSGAMFERMLCFIDPGRRIVALDTPGFGGSFDPGHAPSLSDYAGWLLDALDTLSIARFHLLGHHTGGCIGLQMQSMAPERVVSLFIIGPVYLTESERDTYRRHYSEPFKPDWNGRYLQQTFEMVRDLGTAADLDLQHRETVAALRAWQARADAYNAVWDADLIDLIDKATCPLQFGCAPDDVLMESFARACRARPDARTVLLTGSNFEPDRDPEGCAVAANAFCAAVEVHGGNDRRSLAERDGGAASPF